MELPHVPHVLPAAIVLPQLLLLFYVLMECTQLDQLFTVLPAKTDTFVYLEKQQLLPH